MIDQSVRYYMPASIHKLLIHGPAILQFFSEPIGIFAEEAQECRHKDFRKYRESHARKCDRISTNTDLINHMLFTSDPKISTLRSKVSSSTPKVALSEALEILSI